MALDTTWSRSPRAAAAINGGDEGEDRRIDGPISRAAVLAKALAGGAALVGGGTILARMRPPAALAASSPAQDQRILNYLLVLERLQAAFYAEAQTSNALDGELSEFAELVGKHEQEHVETLTKLLGAAAKPAPTFQFGAATADRDEFVSTAVELEETAVGAYVATGANLTEDAMVAAGSICAVEARHAAWIRSIAGEHPAPAAADQARGQQRVNRTIRRFAR